MSDGAAATAGAGPGAEAAKPPLSVPLCLAVLFKSLDGDRFRFSASASDGGDVAGPSASAAGALAKVASAATDLVRGLAAVQGRGPLADAAASPKSLSG